jgi:glycine cleavage system H protein
MNSLVRAARYIPRIQYIRQINKYSVPFCLHKNFYSTYYAESHEKIHVKNNVATLGISNYAQGIMGDIIFVDNNYEPDDTVEKGEIVCEIESVKACSEIYLPTNGTIIEINENVLSDFENGSDFWILKYEIEDESELEVLLTKDAYFKHVEENRE